jgi:hypothetical protein
MRTVRRHLGWSVGAWLLCQVAVLIGTPASMCAGVAPPMVAETCTCAHGDGQACPMHHPVQSSRTCSCRSTTDDSTVALASLLGPAAVLPSAVALVEPVSKVDVLARLAASPLDTLSVPEAPPPRA